MALGFPSPLVEDSRKLASKDLEGQLPWICYQCRQLGRSIISLVIAEACQLCIYELNSMIKLDVVCSEL